MSDFKQKWHEVRKKKHSNIIAGVDPAVFEMGRGENGLPRGKDKLDWCMEYIEAVAPYVVGIKPNAGYFGNVGEREILKRIIERAHELNLLVIVDTKVAEIGSTADAWLYGYLKLGANAVTLAPYAGNIPEMIALAHKRGLAAITMGLMSNPEYSRERVFVHPETGERLWKYRVRVALEAGAEGVVIGGTHTTSDREFMEFVDMTKTREILYLIPGIGHQGGDVEAFLRSGIDTTRCMVNSSRGLMFPNGSGSTSVEQAAAAKGLRDSFNLAT